MPAAAPAPRSTLWPAEDVDAITGLPRGGYFERVVQRLLATGAADRGAAVAVLGADRFRRINELMGFSAGDAVVRILANRIRTFDPSWTVARLGGDEFAVFLPCCPDARSAETGVAALLKVLGAPILLGSRTLHVSVSAGYTHVIREPATARQLLRDSAVAMREAKRRGGAVALEASVSPGRMIPEERHRMESALRLAAEQGEFSLRFQPQVDREGSLQVLECLLHWESPGFGAVAPDVFVSMAEENGMIIPIGEWVIREAARTIRQWEASGLPCPRLAVNVSALQFTSPGFVDRVAAILAASVVPGTFFEFEITERALVRDLDESGKVMADLKALGVTIAIDDFGVGYSPLSYLHRLPVDTLKIDKAFVSDLTKPSGSLPILHTITVLAHHRGLKVVAEGVESSGELELALAARCDLLQGFLLSRPLTNEAAMVLMRDPSGLRKPFELLSEPRQS